MDRYGCLTLYGCIDMGKMQLKYVVKSETLKHI